MIDAVPLDGSKQFAITGASKSFTANDRRKYRAYCKEISIFETEQNRAAAARANSHSPADYEHVTPAAVHDKFKAKIWGEIFLRDQSNINQKNWSAIYDTVLTAFLDNDERTRQKYLAPVYFSLSSEWANRKQYAEALKWIINENVERGLYLEVART